MPNAVVFDFIASTGRTATTYIASVLNQLDGICACHEGYPGASKAQDSFLPLINLENARAYSSPTQASHIVADKRSKAVFEKALAKSLETRLIDVAYYNATLATALLDAHPQARMVGIVRDCASFVRSATTMEGEDPLPVGWANPDKLLSDREKFIAMGRIRPARGTPDKVAWTGWSAIRRNIWLWQETNLALAGAQAGFKRRVCMLPFATLSTDPALFWGRLGQCLDATISADLRDMQSPEVVNKKPAGYQIGPPESWSDEEQEALQIAQCLIDGRVEYDC